MWMLSNVMLFGNYLWKHTRGVWQESVYCNADEFFEMRDQHHCPNLIIVFIAT